MKWKPERHSDILKINKGLSKRYITFNLHFHQYKEF